MGKFIGIFQRKEVQMQNDKEIVKSAMIFIEYETSRSKGRNDFTTLQELKKWLDDHPLIAEKLGYKKK